MIGQCDQGEYSNGNEDMPEPNELSDVWYFEGLGDWTDVGTNEGPIEEPDEWPPEEPEEWPVEEPDEWPPEELNECPPEEPEEWPIEEPDEWPPEEPEEWPEEPDGPPNLSFFGGVDG
jgi:hypothetical protein